MTKAKIEVALRKKGTRDMKNQRDNLGEDRSSLGPSIRKLEGVAKLQSGSQDSTHQDRRKRVIFTRRERCREINSTGNLNGSPYDTRQDHRGETVASLGPGENKKRLKRSPRQTERNRELLVRTTEEKKGVQRDAKEKER